MANSYVDSKMAILHWKQFLITGFFQESKRDGGKVVGCVKKNIGVKESFTEEGSGMSQAE
jgi:hypothetical protein